MQKQWLTIMVIVAVTLLGMFGWELFQTLSGATVETFYVVNKIEPGIFTQPVENIVQQDFYGERLP